MSSLIRWSRSAVAVFIVPLMALAFAACGDGDTAASATDDDAATAATDTTASEDEASSAEPTKIRMVYTSNIISYLPFHVAEQTGIFEDHGIDYSGIQVDTDADAIRALVGGEAEMISGVPEPFVNAIATGVDMKIISSNLNFNIYTMFGSEGVDSLDDVIGKKVAVYTLSNSTYFQARWALDQAGLDSSDVEYVVVGSQAARLAALQEGQVAATIIASPQSVTAEEEGFPVLARFAEMDGIGQYPMTVSVAAGSMVDENPEALARYNEALAEAITFIKENPEEAIEIGVQGLGGDAETLRASLDAVIDAMSTDLEPVGLPFVIETATTYGDIPGDPPTLEDVYFDPQA